MPNRRRVRRNFSRKSVKKTRINTSDSYVRKRKIIKNNLIGFFIFFILTFVLSFVSYNYTLGLLFSLAAIISGAIVIALLLVLFGYLISRKK